MAAGLRYQDQRLPHEEQEIPVSPWFVYLIECANGSIYTGITKDVASRYAKHVCGKGARYTRTHPPVRLLASWAYPDHSSALKAEYRIKRLRPDEKRSLAREPDKLPLDCGTAKP